MSKYQVLKNFDFHNNRDEEDNLMVSNINPIKAKTDNTENFNLLYKSERYLTDTDVLKHENTLRQHQRHHFQNRNPGDHLDGHHYSHDYCNGYVPDPTEYNNENIIGNNNFINNSNETTIISKSFNNIMTPLDSADNAATADDDTMEVPLLQRNCSHNDNDESRRNNYDYNKHLYEYERVCLYKQKGFFSNIDTRATRNAKSKIIWAIALCCIFMVIEFLGGYIAGSLAIMTDAAHLASDCISFVIGLVAMWLGSKPPDAKMSFGYKRFEVMGAIVSILGIWILTATLVFVAIQRIYSNDYGLDANTMMNISGIGILINIIMIFILHTPVLDLPPGSVGSSHGHSHSHSYNGHHGHSHSRSLPSTPTSPQCTDESGHLRTENARSSLLPTDIDVDDHVGAKTRTDAIDTGDATSIKLSSMPMKLNDSLVKRQREGNEKNLNLRAAMIHVIGDLVQSFGVFLAAVLIKIFPKAAFLDPLCTLLFSIIVIMTTTNLFTESMHLIMDAVPQGLATDDLEMDLLNIEGVKSVHHLNVWNHTSNHSMLMVHLITDILSDSNTVLKKATDVAGSVKYNIKHSTIQIERLNS